MSRVFFKIVTKFKSKYGSNFGSKVLEKNALSPLSPAIEWLESSENDKNNFTKQIFIHVRT